VTRFTSYIDGDGTSWVDGTQVAADPTVRQPIALHLMRRDRRSASTLAVPATPDWGVGRMLARALDVGAPIPPRW